MTDEELDALDEVYDTMMEVQRNPTGAWQAIQDQAAAITTLRAQLAEARANEAALAEIRKTLAAPDDWHPVDAVKALKRSHDRAEQRVATLEAALSIANATLAAQIEVDAEIVQFRHDENEIMRNTWATPKLTSLDDVADEIRTQPHDRTALERMLADAREKALREKEDVQAGAGNQMPDLRSGVQEAVFARKREG